MNPQTLINLWRWLTDPLPGESGPVPRRARALALGSTALLITAYGLLRARHFAFVATLAVG